MIKKKLYTRTLQIVSKLANHSINYFPDKAEPFFPKDDAVSPAAQSSFPSSGELLLFSCHEVLLHHPMSCNLSRAV